MKRCLTGVALLFSVVVLSVIGMTGTKSTESERAIEDFFNYSLLDRLVKLSGFGPRCTLGPVIPEINNLKAILVSLTLYSGDMGGVYPTGTDANAAFRQLFAVSADCEKMFWSRWAPGYCHPNAEPDENIGQLGDDPYGQALEAGENCWAYVNGVKDGAPSDTPLVARVLTAPNGRSVVLLGTVDGSARVIRIKPDQSLADVLAPMPEKVEGAKLLMPLRRSY